MQGSYSNTVGLPSGTVEAGFAAAQSWRWGFEIVVALVLLEAAVWSSGLVQAICFWGAVAWIVGTTVLPARQGADLGLRMRGARGMLWLLSLSLGCAAAAILIAWYTGSLHPAFGSGTRPWHYAAYALWALFQQFTLQSYFFLRLERLLGNSQRAVLMCALLFSLLHVPNPFLALTTFLAGLIFCELFRRHRSIYPLGLAHAVCGLCIAVTFSSDLHHDMRVGRGFFDYPSARSSLYSLDKQQDYPQPPSPPAGQQP